MTHRYAGKVASSSAGLTRHHEAALGMPSQIAPIPRHDQEPESDRPISSDRTNGFLQGKLEVPDEFDARLSSEVQDVFECVAAGGASSAQAEGDESFPTSQSKCTWNYGVISFRHGEDAWCAIHEVYYGNGVPTAYTSSPAVVMRHPEEGDEAGNRTMDRMLVALAKPV